MALPKEQERRFDEAAEEFDKELRALYSEFTMEQKQAVVAVLDLIEDYYLEAAYDRICRKLRKLRPPSMPNDLADVPLADVGYDSYALRGGTLSEPEFWKAVGEAMDALFKPSVHYRVKDGQ